MNILQTLTKIIQEANPDLPRVPECLPLPLKYDNMVYLFGKDGEMVADFDFRIRGWGRIQKEEDAEKKQDAIAEYIADATNHYSDINIEHVLVAIGQKKLLEEAIVEVGVYSTILEHLIYNLWIINTSLHLQDEPTINFLLDVLVEKK